MALTPDGGSLAIHVQPVTNDYHFKSYVLSVRAIDGGIVSDALAITHGASSTGEHALFSQGMIYKDDNTLFMTFMQTSFKGRKKGNMSWYAGFYYVTRVDLLS